jgi:hypothetical protein
MIFKKINIFLKKEFSFFFILASFGLFNLIYLLIKFHTLIPYFRDDYWYRAIGQGYGLLDILKKSIGISLDLGRPSMIVHSFLTAASFTNFLPLRYFTQAFPILFLLFTSSFYVFKKSSRNCGLAFFAIVCFGTFYDNGHHLIGAFPAALPTGLSICFFYFFLANNSSSGSMPIKLIRVLFFITPFFIYEVYLVINLAFLFSLIISDENRALALKRFLPEIFILFFYAIIELIFRHHANFPYNGVSISFDIEAILFAFFTFSMGFISTILEVKFFLFLFIFYVFFKTIKRNQWKINIPEVHFFLIWLVPPLLISITERYQQYANSGESIYVTTYLSQIGFWGFIVLTIFRLREIWQKVIVSSICIFMFFTWAESSNSTIKGRLRDQFKTNRQFSLLKSKDCVSKNDIFNSIPSLRTCQKINGWQCETILNAIVKEQNFKMCSY